MPLVFKAGKCIYWQMDINATTDMKADLMKYSDKWGRRLVCQVCSQFSEKLYKMIYEPLTLRMHSMLRCFHNNMLTKYAVKHRNNYYYTESAD